MISQINSFLANVESQRTKYFDRPESFSRKRSLLLKYTFVLILQNMTKGIDLELFNFFNKLGLLERLCTKSAFSQARYKLKWIVFKDFMQLIPSWSKRKMKRWKGFRLLAIDGSKLNLPESESIAGFFGRHGNQHKKGVPMALLSGSFDVLNEYFVDAALDKTRTSEKILY